MIYVPITEYKTLLPKEFPMYATEANRTVGSRIKFQKRQHAKSSLRSQMYGEHNGKNLLGEIVVYKYNTLIEMYEAIFDSTSPLAQAYCDKVLTGDEMVAMIDW